MTPVIFIQSAVAMGRAVAAFFLRFWRQSLALPEYCGCVRAALRSYMLLGMVAFATEWRVYVFVVRLLAFCLILYGIFDKNRR